jgi:hypothetical protein
MATSIPNHKEVARGTLRSTNFPGEEDTYQSKNPYNREQKMQTLEKDEEILKNQRSRWLYWFSYLQGKKRD